MEHSCELVRFSCGGTRNELASAHVFFGVRSLFLSWRVQELDDRSVSGVRVLKECFFAGCNLILLEPASFDQGIAGCLHDFVGRNRSSRNLARDFCLRKLFLESL